MFARVKSRLSLKVRVNRWFAQSALTETSVGAFVSTTDEPTALRIEFAGAGSVSNWTEKLVALAWFGK